MKIIRTAQFQGAANYQLEMTIYDTATESDREVIVDFNYTRGTPNVRYRGNGDPGYPGSSPDVEIISVSDAMTGQELDPKQYAASMRGIEEHCLIYGNDRQ